MKKKMGRPVGSTNSKPNKSIEEIRQLKKELYQLQGQVIALENIIEMHIDKL